ncbi:MAG: carboxypeptidase-like regulatory domain-containing protein [Thermoguttaceae bacterium]|nr:carboxypeptidase-like regulatory domain-containing protein [Thermoguttaceae bacterium]MDW8037599.1 carboxypeptidase-like regulatory domain-containing protein [Thermoguttaceae bacterium]
MRIWTIWAIWVIWVAGLGITYPSILLADSPLNGDKLITVLRPDHPVDKDFLVYAGAVLEAGYLPASLVESTFLWARQKPQHQARYFREGLIRRARLQGIELPTGQPPLQGTIQGQVLFIVNLGLIKIPVPVPNATVRLADRQTTTDSWGRFSFIQVPFGEYSLQAEGYAGLGKRKGSGQVRLPTRPPSTEPAWIVIYVQ